MARLNQKAYQILREEIKKNAGQDPISKLEKKMVLEELKKLRVQEGTPASLAELRQAVIHQYSNFSKKTLSAAAKANQTFELNKSSPGNILKSIAPFFIIGVAGATVIGVVNLPYPMIRKPVARIAPILLLPSYISMDRNYREAIAHVEQADQLINNATSAKDIDLGAEKVQAAQANLDRLPVWFLGYEPQMYCTFFSCTWQFTYDEFESARKLVGRMEAQVFQERNAQLELTAADTSLRQAREEYEMATNATEKQKAIANWQGAIDQMEQIFPETLAAKIANPKLTAAQRDFKQIAGSSASLKRTSNLIEAGKAFGMQAAILSQNPPHSATQWEQVAELWESAIGQLKQVKVDEASYGEAQAKLAEYQSNLGIVKIRISSEKESAIALKNAKQLIANWQSLNTAETPNQSEMARTLQLIVNELEIIKGGTTAFAEAQDLLNYAKDAQQN